MLSAAYTDGILHKYSSVVSTRPRDKILFVCSLR